MLGESLTIDYLLRSTWLAAQKMYNEQASAYDSTLNMDFTANQKHSF